MSALSLAMVSCQGLIDAVFGIEDTPTNTSVKPSTPSSDDSSSSSTKELEALANLNPDEPIIASLANAKGESLVLMGSKDDSGFPLMLEQMIINIPEEENPTEIFLDNSEKVKKMVAPNGVNFLFEWLSETEAAITVVDPNTNEQLNTVIDFANQESDLTTAKTRSATQIVRTGKTVMTIEAINTDMLQNTKALTRAENGIVGDVYLDQCGAPATAQCWVDVYDYSNLTGAYGRGKYRGRFACTKIEDGHYQYKLPQNYNKQHNAADYCEAINNVFDKVCKLNSFTAPGSGAKEFLCVALSAAIASTSAADFGLSAPAAALFLEACMKISLSLDVACSLNSGNMDLPEGTPTLTDGLCGIIKEADYTWTDPLFLVPVVNALPTNIYGTTQIYKAGEGLKPMSITWGGNPVINTFTLNPPKPVHGVSYLAIAELACLPLGTKVTMDIIGTDNYTDSQTCEIGQGESIYYKATLKVPGAATGVKDICTVTVVTPNGETVTKKASLVFQ